mmetsp:Transcript_51400/g.137176  ORF Transcript_51400/g.137176 Transcript_51400/m.137176 type:complete len:259 (-) Transcript_51400:38-814(-)
MLDVEEAHCHKEDNTEQDTEGTLHANDQKRWDRVFAHDVLFVDQHRCLKHLGCDAESDAQELLVDRPSAGGRSWPTHQTAQRDEGYAEEHQEDPHEMILVLLPAEEHDAEETSENHDSAACHLDHRRSDEHVGHVHQRRGNPIKQTSDCKDVLGHVLCVHRGVTTHPENNQTQKLTDHHEQTLEVRVVEDVRLSAWARGHRLHHHEFHEQRVQSATDEHDEHETNDPRRQTAADGPMSFRHFWRQGARYKSAGVGRLS